MLNQAGKNAVMYAAEGGRVEVNTNNNKNKNMRLLEN